MPKTFLQFNQQLNEFFIEKIKPARLDPDTGLPIKRSSMTHPDDERYDRRTDPADAADTTKRGVIAHGIGAAKGILTSALPRAIFKSAARYFGGNLGADWASNTLQSKDIADVKKQNAEKMKDIDKQLVITHQKLKDAKLAASQDKDPNNADVHKKNIDRLQSAIKYHNSMKDRIVDNNRMRDVALRNLKTTGDIHGHDPLRRDLEPDMPTRSGSRSGGKKRRGGLSSSEIRDLQNTNPSLYRQIAQHQRKTGARYTDRDLMGD